ncbi:MAG: serine/threonine protein kinase [Deltaproteobacteria bacterium]|nr:serine/threonine protein kinase [Deltaproteobacteria bacterium]
MVKPPDKKGNRAQGNPPPPPATRKPPLPSVAAKIPPLPPRVPGPRTGEGVSPPIDQERPRKELEREELPEEVTIGHGWVGRIIDDRYRITEIIGEGGMGSVFAAEHLALHKDVAIKIIRPDYGADGEVAVRFAREAMATAQLEHPHVVSAIDYGKLPEGGAYLVMQLVRGRSLTEVLEMQGSLHWSKACELGAQVADAMSAANSYGIVHRDLKPDNILIQPRKDGTDLVKILDFGIARIKDQGRSAPAGAMPREKLTQLGAIVGTPGYMAPEQAVGDRVDHRADLYALGVILWETIAGRRLWDDDDLTSLIKTQLGITPPRIREVVDDETIPTELDDLVAQLLSRAPADRPNQAGVVCDILRKLSFGPLTGEYPAFQIKQEPSDPGYGESEANAGFGGSVTKIRKRWKWILGFALILAVLLMSLLMSGRWADWFYYL